MNTCVIEINDAGVWVADDAGVRLVSPGYAVAEGKHLAVGAPAQARARLNPRRTHDRFWVQLDQQPLTRPAGRAHSHADLAYFHLKAVWDEYIGAAGVPDEVLLAAPAGYDKNRLALLLGIAQACEMPVSGLVSAPVAAAATVAGEHARLVLDAQLHRLTATRVTADQALELDADRVLAKQGLASLQDAWAAMIAERFVRESRFDPLHDGQTEQRLYSSLPGWVSALAEDTTIHCELSGGRTHHIELDRRDLADAATAFYRPLSEAAAGAGNDVVVLTTRLAGLPGLVEYITTQTGVAPVTLADGAIAQAILAHREAIRSNGEAPAYITRLPGPIADACMPPRADMETETATAPTHVLHEWRAYPLGSRPLALDAAQGPSMGNDNQAACSLRIDGGAAVLQASSNSVNLNGRPANGDVTVVAGDRISSPAGEWLLIAQVETN